MSEPPLTLRLQDAAATDRAGAALGLALRPGDCVLLSGELGAGKSALARAAILARLAQAGLREEAPSPTYTLAQRYETPDAEIWHADLYRLGDPEEIEELGLDEAFAAAITLIEWPERLGPHRPARALAISLAFDGAGRVLRAVPEGPGWEAALAALNDA